MRPNLNKGLAVGLIAGFVAAALVFAGCLWSSTLPVATDGSLAWAFRPWWRPSNWLAAAAAFVSVGGMLGVAAAFRPDFRRKR